MKKKQVKIKSIAEFKALFLPKYYNFEKKELYEKPDKDNGIKIALSILEGIKKDVGTIKI